MAVNGGRGPASLHIVGVSIPRSGHNLVVRLLQALIPLDLFYCEFYGVPGCCQAVPCARRGALPITFQKTHDFELNVPTDIPDAVYVILHRVPVPAVLSARELYADDYGEEIAADRDEYAVWLGRNAEYYVSFTERWLQQPPPRSVLIDYDDLARDPAAALRQVLETIGVEADDRAVHQAVAKTMQYGGLFGERPYVPRSIEKSRYLDRELLPVYESIIVDHLPGLAGGRVFEAVEYQRTLTGQVFEVLRVWRAGDTEAAIRLIDRAIETAPENALLYYEHAALLQEQRRFAEAHRSLRQAMTLMPTHRPILEACVTVSLAAGDPSTVVEPMERLNALSEPTLAGQLRLALVRTHGGDGEAAADLLAQVQREMPDDADVWRYVSEIRRLRGELEEALAAIEMAARLAPLHGELYAYRADVLLELGRHGDAADAARAALAIDPSQRAWWKLLVEAHLRAGDAAGALAATNEALDEIPDDAELHATLDDLRRQLPEPAEPGSPEHRQIARLQIQLAQLRAALGAAERRLYEVEVRKQQQLEESWDQTHKLDDALQEKEQAMRAAWAQARFLTATLKEREEAMQAQARQLDDAMQAAWRHAAVLDAALQEKEQAMQAAWRRAEALDMRARLLHIALLQAGREDLVPPIPFD